MVVKSPVCWLLPPELELTDSVQREVVVDGTDSVQRVVVLVVVVGTDPVPCPPGTLTEVLVLVVTVRKVEEVDVAVDSDVWTVLTGVSSVVVVAKVVVYATVVEADWAGWDVVVEMAVVGG